MADFIHFEADVDDEEIDVVTIDEKEEPMVIDEFD